MELLEPRLAIAGALALAASGLAINLPAAQAATLQPGEDSTASASNAPVVTDGEADDRGDGPPLSGMDVVPTPAGADPQQDGSDDQAMADAPPRSAGTPGEIALFVPEEDHSAPESFVYLSAPAVHTTTDVPWDWDQASASPLPHVTQDIPPDCLDRLATRLRRAHCPM